MGGNGAGFLLGIDAGTTALKAVLIDLEGMPVAQAQQEYATHHPMDRAAEQDPEDWWHAACRTIRAVLQQSRIDPAAIRGVGISSQAPTMLPVDSEGRPLSRAHIWMDRRCEEQCAWMRAHVDMERLRSVSGADADPFYVAPKILWLGQHHPEVYAQTHLFVQINGYLAFRLSGAWSMDLSHGGLTGFFDLIDGAWSPELCGALGIAMEKLPPVVPPTEVIGGVTEAAGEETGLRAGTPIVAGTVDGTAAALEAGVTEPGQACEMTGQSTVLLACTERPVLGTRLTVMHHAIPNAYLLLGAMVSGGGNLRWFRDQLGAVETQAATQLGLDPFELLSLQATRSEPGAGGLIFLPYMYGERAPIWNSNARGVFFGLSLATRRADLVRALMEGTTYGLRHNIEAVEAAGVRVDRLRTVGGAARSAVWNQIKADITGREIEIPRVAIGAPLSDALLAGVGVGIYRDLQSAIEQTVQVGARFTPDPSRQRVYDRYYAIFRSVYEHLGSDFDALAAAASSE